MTDRPMNGAESLVRSLSASGVELCLANPGTSEMQFVDALDRTGLMRCVLGLFEGVATGAADGYARMTGKPAATLLHLAPGFANGAANVHNARKARTPMVNIVGEHETRHLKYDAPLTADIEAAVAPFSNWVRTAASADSIARDAAEAVAAARGRPGRIATLIAPGEAGWDPVSDTSIPGPVAPDGPRPIAEATVEQAAGMLDGAAPAVIIAGGSVLENPPAMARLRAVAENAGAVVVAPGANRRIEHGAGRASPKRIPYAIDLALEGLSRFRRAILIEAQAPVAFFAYPNKPSELLPEGCEVMTLADFDQDGTEAIALLAERLRAGAMPMTPNRAKAEAPRAGPITPDSLPAAIAAALPENAVVVDESVTSGRGIYDACAGAAPSSWLALTGGAIGIGPPLAAGAALGAPDRPVIALQADGSAMYTIQALWTQAREGLNVTTVIFANRTYRILKGELMNVGANPGPTALDMLDIDRPELNFVEIAKGMGVPGRRVEDAAELSRMIADAAREPGPFVIEAMM